MLESFSAMSARPIKQTFISKTAQVSALASKNHSNNSSIVRDSTNSKVKNKNLQMVRQKTGVKHTQILKKKVTTNLATTFTKTGGGSTGILNFNLSSKKKEVNKSLNAKVIPISKKKQAEKKSKAIKFTSPEVTGSNLLLIDDSISAQRLKIENRSEANLRINLKKKKQPS